MIKEKAKIKYEINQDDQGMCSSCFIEVQTEFLKDDKVIGRECTRNVISLDKLLHNISNLKNQPQSLAATVPVVSEI